MTRRDRHAALQMAAITAAIVFIIAIAGKLL
jgi:hypothetical protein